MKDNVKITECDNCFFINRQEEQCDHPSIISNNNYNPRNAIDEDGNMLISLFCPLRNVKEIFIPQKIKIDLKEEFFEERMKD